MSQPDQVRVEAKLLFFGDTPAEALRKAAAYFGETQDDLHAEFAVTVKFARGRYVATVASPGAKCDRAIETLGSVGIDVRVLGLLTAVATIRRRLEDSIGDAEGGTDAPLGRLVAREATQAGRLVPGEFDVDGSIEYLLGLGIPPEQIVRRFIELRAETAARGPD